MTLTVLAIRKRCVPPLDDHMVRVVATVAQYRDYLRNLALDEQFSRDSYEVIQAVMREAAQRSEVLIEQAD